MAEYFIFAPDRVRVLSSVMYESCGEGNQKPVIIVETDIDPFPDTLSGNSLRPSKKPGIANEAQSIFPPREIR